MGHVTSSGSGQWPELDALVDRLQAAHADVARAQATEAAVLAEAVALVLTRTAQHPARGSDLPLREVSAELATALRTSDRTVQRRMGEAHALVNDLPDTMRAWQHSEIDAGHVAAIISAGAHLSAELRGRFEEHALEAARHETAARMQQIARAIAARVDPDGAASRIRAAESERQVRVYDTADGMARLLADLPAVLAHAIHDRLTEQARSVRAAGGEPPADESGSTDQTPAAGPLTDPPNVAQDRPATDGPLSDADAAERAVPQADAVTGPTAAPSTPAEHSSHGDETAAPADTRTFDQLRADILCDTLLSGAPTAHGEGLDAITAHVQVTVPLGTLAGASEEPALLAGGEPVSPDAVRLLAALAPGWDRVFTDPATGAVCEVDRYRPSAELRRLLRARDEHCRFPGCRRSAHRCDLDHTLDAAQGGPTCVENLSHLCRRHHTLKHQTAWTVTQLAGGVLEWRSPTGRHHRDRPPATVRFVPEAEPPPF